MGSKLHGFLVVELDKFGRNDDKFVPDNDLM